MARNKEQARHGDTMSARRTGRLPLWFYQVLLAGVDGVISAYVLATAFRLRLINHWPAATEILTALNPIQVLATVGMEGFRPYLHLLVVLPVLRITTLGYQHLYDLKGEFSFLDDAARVFKAVTLATLGIIVIAFMYRGVFEFREFSYSRGVFIIDWLSALTIIGAIRVAVRWIQISLRRRSKNLIRSIIVGEGPLAELCATEITTKPRVGYRLLGTVTRGRSEPVEHRPVLGTFTELPELLRAHDVEQVFIADPDIAPERLFESIMKAWRDRPVHFSLIPQLLHSLPSKTDIDQIGSLPMIKLFQEPLRGPNRWIKRSADLLISGTALMLLSPFLAILYLLIRFESDGPAIFSQDRIGMDGRGFRAHKYRTMHVNIDERPHREVMTKNIRGEIHSNSDPELYGKVPDDERVTRLGRWLRRFSLDELPQLYNVLKGEMSVVGPRPPIGYEVEHYTAWQRKRLEVKPGLTGLWQVSGRNRLPFEKMIELDIYYIEHWSLWLDLMIVLKTLPAIFRRETA